MDGLRHLIDVVQLGTRSASIVRLLPQPLGANFDPAAAGLAAPRPVGPLAELAVGRTGDDAGLLDVACKRVQEVISFILSLLATIAYGSLHILISKY